MPTPLSGTRMRLNNERLVLACLREHSSLSRSQLAERLGLTRAAISRIVAALLDRDLVEEVGNATIPGSPGRPVTLLRLAQRWVGIGVDCRIDHTEVIAVDMSGAQLRRLPVPLPAKPTPTEFVSAVKQAVTDLTVGLDHEVTGVGVAFPGLMANQRREVRRSYHLGWENVPLAELLETALNLRVELRHVAECAAMANARQPEVKDVGRLLHIQIGSGLGMALTRHGALDETLPVGWGGAGHVLLGNPDLPCVCGRRGCVDTVVGFDAFAARAREHGLRLGDSPDGMDRLARQISGLAADGVGWATESVSDLIRHLSRVVAIFTTIEMPDKVTLGGYVLALGEGFLQELNRTVADHLLAPSPVVITSIGDAAPAIGAAHLGLNQIAAPPRR